jgi:hypothetical protein
MQCICMYCMYMVCVCMYTLVMYGYGICVYIVVWWLNCCTHMWAKTVLHKPDTANLSIINLELRVEDLDACCIFMYTQKYSRSPLFYINSWAMIWPIDYKADACWEMNHQKRGWALQMCLHVTRRLISYWTTFPDCFAATYPRILTHTAKYIHIHAYTDVQNFRPSAYCIACIWMFPVFSHDPDTNTWKYLKKRAYTVNTCQWWLICLYVLYSYILYVCKYHV